MGERAVNRLKVLTIVLGSSTLIFFFASLDTESPKNAKTFGEAASGPLTASIFQGIAVLCAVPAVISLLLYILYKPKGRK